MQTHAVIAGPGLQDQIDESVYIHFTYPGKVDKLQPPFLGGWFPHKRSNKWQQDSPLLSKDRTGSRSFDQFRGPENRVFRAGPHEKPPATSAESYHSKSWHVAVFWGSKGYPLAE